MTEHAAKGENPFWIKLSGKRDREKGRYLFSVFFYIKKAKWRCLSDGAEENAAF